MFSNVLKPYLIFNLILFFAFSISVNSFVEIEYINLIFYIFFHITYIYLLFYHYHFSIYIIGLFYGIFFDILLMNSIGSHLVSLLILIFLYVFLKKYLFLLSSLQISITIFITLNAVIYFEIFYAFVFNNFYLNILQLLNYFIIALIIFIPTIFVLNKIDN